MKSSYSSVGWVCYDVGKKKPSKKETPVRSVQFALMTVISAGLAMAMVFFLAPMVNHPLAGLAGLGVQQSEGSIVEQAAEQGVPEGAWLINPDTHEPGTVPPLNEWLFTPSSGIPSLEESFGTVADALREAAR